jgi:hypothetical protein
LIHVGSNDGYVMVDDFNEKNVVYNFGGSGSLKET